MCAWASTSALSGHTGSVLAVEVSATGTYCLSGSKDRTIRLWNPHKGTQIKVYRAHGGDVRALAVFLGNDKFVSGGSDKQVNLWDVTTGTVIRRFHGHDAAVNAVRLAAEEESVVVTASYDQTVAFWDMRSRNSRAIQTVRVAKDSVTSLAASERHCVHAGSVDGSVYTLDVRAGSIIRDYIGHAVTSVAIPEAGSIVAAACMDSTVRLLEAGSAELLGAYRGHEHQAFHIPCTFLSEDMFIAAGSENGAIHIWDVVKKSTVAKIHAHSTVVSALSAVPGSSSLVSGCTDGVIKMWQQA